ncbi:MAG: alpha/beta fold hydrolase [Actinobacteria bacterium]|jgi:pimeloyl-ACP methyl ester carboxylesterase|nr:alpha/beta fold hydrolase [Actinomycetota bacterium]MCO5299436.1 alpha/beta hydrolase [Candidatus Nanopelagicales bacterium]MCB9427848.1 alpha/beta fold hydrolase [Actinomycetota bacterium]HPE12692.1 alpha/beta fold hydrolase [Actinomycetota bacterium]HPJ19621.1 alpha/beta fold hydrolase [Actinomycetota bacterium]
MKPAPKVLRRGEWGWPTKPVHLEVLSEVVPETDRPPLLFLHGLGHGAWCFAQNWQAAAAERGYSSYAMSLRGHGGSGGQTRLGRTTLRDYVHDVLQVISSLDQPPVLVAHSLGTLVAQRVLQRYPARAGVLLTPIPAGGIPSTMVSGLRSKPVDFTRAVLGGTLRLNAADLFADLPEATAREYVSRIGRESPWAQYAMLVPEALRPIESPVMVVGAEKDTLVAAADVRRCARALGVEPVWVPGGHDVMLDGSWRTVLSTVLDWVDTTCPPGPPLPGARQMQPLEVTFT